MELITSDKKKCSIVIGESLLVKASEFAGSKGRQAALVIDLNVNRLYSKKIKAAFKDKFTVILPAGEKSKSRKEKERLETLLMEKHFGKDSIIVAIGGGVTTDIAGYVASTYNRGIPYINIPTTLLGMVDASIGGKTGINTEHGKNLVGTIWQPLSVFVDVDFLKSLPKEEILNGIAEIVKIAAVLDEPLFSFIEKNTDKILKLDRKTIIYVITKAIQLKKKIVETDPDERGIRQILNFGHTIGHAIESASDFQVKHGFCVSIGISAEAKISRALDILSRADEKRINFLLEKIGLPIKIPKLKGHKEIKEDMLLEKLISDKKTRSKKPHFVLLEKIGKVKSSRSDFSFPAEDKLIKDALRECR